MVLPKDVRENDIPYDAEHFICTEIESTDFKKSNLASKMTSSKNKKIKKIPYTTSTVNLTEPTNAESLDKKDMIGTLENIASLQPGKNA